jgi:peptide/nickel transport system permease protein
MRHGNGVVGALVMMVVIGTAALAPWIAPYNPIAQDFGQSLRAPGGGHWLGTDEFGRDVLSRIIWGSRISLEVGFVAISIGATIGSLIGLVTGYFGRWLDTLLMRMMDTLMAFPALLLAIAIAAMLRGGLPSLILAIGFANIPQFARFVRGEALRIRSFTYVEAARGIGANDVRILLRHLLPNLVSALVVMVSLRLSVAVLAEATLSFLGFGVAPPTPTWGGMIADGRKQLTVAPWMAIAPGVALTSMVLAVNLLGDSLRDLLDPRLRGTHGD